MLLGGFETATQLSETITLEFYLWTTAPHLNFVENVPSEIMEHCLIDIIPFWSIQWYV